jgi:hypothetical protein
MRLEEAGLRRAGWSRLFRCRLQQPQQPRVLRTQLRCQGTEFREFLREPRGIRRLEIVFHDLRRSWDGQMPAWLRRSMRAALRACVCRNAMVWVVNVS